MFKYCRIPKSQSGIIPGTYGRYVIELSGVVYDRLENHIVEPNGDFYLLNLPWHSEPIAVAKLIALVFKGWHAPLESVSKCQVLNAVDTEGSIHPANLIWKFPEDGLEVPTYPGYYFIPSFTCYAINRELRIISLFEGMAKITNLSTTGYRDLGLRRDDGQYVGTNLHRAAALTFLSYGNDINELVVNHTDSDRDNTDLDNLEWVTQSENVLHGIAAKYGFSGSAKDKAILSMLTRRGVNVDGLILSHDGIEVKDIKTEEIQFFTSQEQAAKTIGVSPGTISLKVSGQAIYPVIKDQYIVRRKGNPWPTWDSEVEFIQAKDKTTLVKNVETGEVVTYASAKAAYLALGLSKKVVTTRLRRKDLRPVSGYIFKYKSDEGSWE